MIYTTFTNFFFFTIHIYTSRLIRLTFICTPHIRNTIKRIILTLFIFITF